VTALDGAKPQPLRRLSQAVAVDRIVLEHQQRVEQFAKPCRLLQLAKPDVLMHQQHGLALLRPPQQLRHRLRRRQPKPQRQRIDEQPHHVLDAGKLRRPSRQGHAEHHVVAPAQPAEQQPERRLQQCVQGHGLRPRRPLERGRKRSPNRQHDPLRRHCQPAARPRRRQQRAGLKPRQAVAQRRERRRAILPRDPTQIRAIRRHRRQFVGTPAPPIGLQQLPHQDRRRPAIHQKVMVADQQPVPISRKPQQRKPQQRRRRHVKPLQPVGRRNLRNTLLLVRRIEPAEIDQPPRHLGPRQHHLHRTTQALMPEA
jgi:hypothetical protein